LFSFQGLLPQSALPFTHCDSWHIVVILLLHARFNACFNDVSKDVLLALDQAEYYRLYAGGSPQLGSEK